MGEFDSDPIAPFFRNTFDLDMDLTGRSWDIGVTRGRPGHAYFRLAYKEIRFKDGSWTDYDGTLNTTQGVRARGFLAEKLWRIGPSRWPIAPAIAFGGGVGVLVGEVTQVDHYTTYVQTAPGVYTEKEYVSAPRTAPASELFFGSKWFPFLNLGVGVTGSIAERVTVSAMIAGFDFPGRYFGSLQVTYWLRK